MATRRKPKSTSSDGMSIVDAVGSGYNGTILAYGQTGSGKTHTMRGGISGLKRASHRARCCSF